MQQTHNKNLNPVHERSEAGRGGSPLRKIEVLCSDDVADTLHFYLCYAGYRPGLLLLSWLFYGNKKHSQNGTGKKLEFSAFYQYRSG